MIVVWVFLEMMLWQLSQLVAVWTNLPSFFSGWQVKHVSGLMSFGSMKGCSIGSSAQTSNGSKRKTTKGKKWRIGLTFASFADRFAEADGGASRLRNLRVRIVEQKLPGSCDAANSQSS
jgi:hypothetical protein